MCLNVFQLYEQWFEEPCLLETGNFYRQEARKLLDEYNCSEYMERVSLQLLNVLPFTSCMFTGFTLTMLAVTDYWIALCFVATGFTEPADWHSFPCEYSYLLRQQEQWRSIVMSMSVCMSVCVSVCLSVREHISQTTRMMLTHFCACCLWLWPALVAEWLTHSVTMCSRAWCT